MNHLGFWSEYRNPLSSFPSPFPFAVRLRCCGLGGGKVDIRPHLRGKLTTL